MRLTAILLPVRVWRQDSAAPGKEVILAKKKAKRAIDRSIAERVAAAAEALAGRPAKPPGRGSPQFVLRYSPEMRDKIARLAKANDRSINSELIALLERALSHSNDVEQLQASTGELFDRLEKLEGLVREHEALLSGRNPHNVEK
jgi:hypothetical protein